MEWSRKTDMILLIYLPWKNPSRQNWELQAKREIEKTISKAHSDPIASTHRNVTDKEMVESVKSVIGRLLSHLAVGIHLRFTDDTLFASCPSQKLGNINTG